ncbi:hypothetical protein ACOME3_001051 [Neoechinorhynchus agilis]
MDYTYKSYVWLTSNSYEFQPLCFQDDPDEGFVVHELDEEPIDLENDESESPVLLENSPPPTAEYYKRIEPQIFQKLKNFSIEKYQRYPTIGPRRTLADDCIGKSPILVSTISLLSFVNFFNLVLPINKLFKREPLADLEEAKNHLPALRIISAFFGLFSSENMRRLTADKVREELVKIELVGNAIIDCRGDPATFIRALLSSLHREINHCRRKYEESTAGLNGTANQQHESICRNGHVNQQQQQQQRLTKSLNPVAELLGIKFRSFGNF